MLSHVSARLRHVDIAKGIGILAVILGHTVIEIGRFGYPHPLLLRAIFSFHMPLFFILSGYFIKPRTREASTFVKRVAPWSPKKEFRRLIVPYLVTAACVVALMVLSQLVLRDLPIGGGELARNWLEAAFYGAGDIFPNALWPQAACIGGIWFLLALFWARMITKLASETSFAPIIVIVSATAGVLTANQFFLPWSIQPGLFGSFFVWLGMEAKRTRIFEDKRIPVPVWILIVAVWVRCLCIDQHIVMNSCYAGDSFEAFLNVMLGAVCGSAAVIGLSQVIDEHADVLARPLAFLGELSLYILCVHLVEDIAIFRWSSPATAAIAALGPDAAFALWFILRSGLCAGVAAGISRLIRSAQRR